MEGDGQNAGIAPAPAVSSGEDRQAVKEDLLPPPPPPRPAASEKKKRSRVGRGDSPESAKSERSTTVWRQHAVDQQTGKRAVSFRFACGCNSDSPDP
eukprot:5620619-Lingulodinium_polyedra.AAC.1